MFVSLHEFQADRVAASLNTVSAGVVSTLNSAVLRAELVSGQHFQRIGKVAHLSASRAIRACRRVPLSAGVAVGVVASDVSPTPVGVEHNRALRGSAATARTALRDSDPGVGLRCVSANLLGTDDSEVSESGESD
jgi:hypothetical protein